MKDEPHFIYAKNRNVWKGEPAQVCHPREAMSNLLGVNPDYTRLSESIIGTLITSAILIILSSVIYSEFLVILSQLRDRNFGGIDNRMLIWAVLILGVFPLFSLFRRYFSGLRVNILRYLRKDTLLRLSQIGDRVVGIVEKIENHSTIIYYYYNQSGDRHYEEYRTIQIVVDKVKPMSKVAVLKYGNQHILL
jgi:hypothetical protein